MPTDSASLSSAAEFVVLNVSVAEPGETAAEVWQRLRGSMLDSADDLVVVSEGKIAGMVRLEDLIAAEDDTPMSQIMDPHPPVVKPGMNRSTPRHRRSPTASEASQSSIKMALSKG